MATLSLYFLIRSVSDCIWPNAISLQRRQNLDQKCDLEWKPLLLLTMTVVTSIFMLANKLGRVHALRLEFKEHGRLKKEAEKLLSELTGQAAQGAALSRPGDMVPPSSSAVASDPAAPAPVPATAGSAIANQAAAVPAGAPVGVPLGEVRGECPACNRNVYSTDEGRFREGGRYYHRDCAPGEGAGNAAAALDDLEFAVARNTQPTASSSSSSNVLPTPQGDFRGDCPVCGKAVYSTDDGRVRDGDDYYHKDCVKGTCCKCGMNVYATQERSKEGTSYYHLECPV